MNTRKKKNSQYEFENSCAVQSSISPIKTPGQSEADQKSDLSDFESGTVQGGRCEATPTGGDSLTCLYSNNTAQNSDFIRQAILSSKSLFTPYHKKQAETIYLNTARFLKVHGLNYVGFLTLTFRENVTDAKEAYRRFCSLRKHYLSKQYGEWMLVKERQKRGAWHYHILIDCKVNIRTGVNWDEVMPKKGKKANLRSCNAALKNLWGLNRAAMAKYGFGIPHLLPVRSNAEAMARYVGKYLSKNVEGKLLSGNTKNDKGVRLFSASSGFTRSSPKFSWNTDGAKEWRRKLKDFTLLIAGLENMDQLKEKYGPRWAYHLCESIHYVDQHLTTKGLPVIDNGDLIDTKTGTVLF